MPINQEAYIGHLFAEYAAINLRIDAYVASSFKDTKLLAAAGAILLWQPIMNQFDKTKVVDGYCSLLFFGFLMIALVIAVLEYRNLLKISMISFYMERLLDVENELKKLHPATKITSFNVASTWPSWLKKRHNPIIRRYMLALYGTIVIVPAFVIAATLIKCPWGFLYSGAYLVLSLALFWTLYRAAWRLGAEVT